MNIDDLALDGGLFILASPVLALRGLYRAARRFAFFNAARTASIPCRCGRPVSLVGMWRCSCRFTYQGHLLRFCPICGQIPRMVRCYGCGLTTKLPEAPDD